MATEADLQLHLPTQRKKKHSGQLKKEELEREVWVRFQVDVLRKMLDHEEKVHEFLGRVQHRQDGTSSSSLGIPNFLPPKMKELLAELAMVENEITRLESQISQLQAEVKLEKEATAESKSKQLRQPPPSQNMNPDLDHFPSHPEEGNKELLKEKVSFETKALHFISKAIKGDYNLNDFSISDKALNSRILSDQKENQFQEQSDAHRNKGGKKSGMLIPASPMREPRQPTPRRDRRLETSSDPPSKIPSAPQDAEEESINKWAPNKLSENIVKCLHFIFVRLLRTSRTMELEKSGPISRSTNFSLSFRAEPSLNSKASLLLQKDSRQQDPYGIFDLEESITRDVGPYKNLVRFTANSVDPKCISNSSSIALFQKLKLLMNNLQKVDLKHMNYQQKLAFWINMYNASIMHAFLQYGVPSNSSPEKLLSLLNKAKLSIGGTTVTARTIEQSILRKPESSLIKEVLGQADKKDNTNLESKVRERYGLEPADPNVTFALCCGTRSSPAVKIYTAEGVMAELEKSKLEYLQASIIVTGTKRIAIPEHLLRHMHDFAQDVESLIEWVCHQLPTSGSLRKSMVDCFRGIPVGKASTIIDKIPYDFEFQYLLAI
ncbi:uncharacterized protein [Coffea arabica]|uniref:Uncharacterized protein isoform X1 n=1 Tax=Coffea arabica TaxID=13443 RepID=A0A6P6U4W9_COFAR|nr:uncharacterized protein LOC113707465 isoform X1 [Coffea arabica]